VPANKSEDSDSITVISNGQLILLWNKVETIPGWGMTREKEESESAYSDATATL